MADPAQPMPQMSFKMQSCGNPILHYRLPYRGCKRKCGERTFVLRGKGLESEKDRYGQRSGTGTVCLTERREDMDPRDTINDILVNLFNEIWKLEEDAIITEEFKDITNNDMHIIEAVGFSGENTMSMVAKKMGITAGSLTTAVNGLVNKKYVTRQRSEQDRRVIFLRLTEKGVRAYEHHQEYHRQMTDAVIGTLEENEIPVLVKTLKGLSEFFRGYKKV